MGTDSITTQEEHPLAHFVLEPDPCHPGLFVRRCLGVTGCESCERSTMLEEIYAVWSRDGLSSAIGEAIYALQDGYGIVGHVPPQGYDWSGIRDSSVPAIRAIYALVHV